MYSLNFEKVKHRNKVSKFNHGEMTIQAKPEFEKSSLFAIQSYLQSSAIEISGSHSNDQKTLLVLLLMKHDPHKPFSTKQNPKHTRI